MKKIKMSICAALIALAMVCMTGCGSGNTNDTTAAPTTGAATTSAMESTTNGTTNGSTTNGSTTNGSTTNGTTTNGTTTGRETTEAGVIEGLVDDVEKGVDDMTGNRETTKAVNESR